MASDVMTIDHLVRECGHHYGGRTNNGYACRHPHVESRDGLTGEGQCFTWSCPLATALMPESEPLDAQWLREQGEDPDLMTDEGGWLFMDPKGPRVVRLPVVGQEDSW